MNEYEKKYCGKYTLAISVPQSEANVYENKSEGASAIVEMTLQQLGDWLDHYGFEETAQEVFDFSVTLHFAKELIQKGE